MPKSDTVSIRKGVGQAKAVIEHDNKVLKREWVNVYLYHVIVNGHSIQAFLSAKEAEDYIKKHYGHVPLVRRDYD